MFFFSRPLKPRPGGDAAKPRERLKLTIHSRNGRETIKISASYVFEFVTVNNAGGEIDLNCVLCCVVGPRG